MPAIVRYRKVGESTININIEVAKADACTINERVARELKSQSAALP
jgi:hypothetical protein